MDAIVRITLELLPGSEPLHGRIDVGDGRWREFDGYVQLIGQLEQLVQAGAERCGHPPGDDQEA